MGRGSSSSSSKPGLYLDPVGNSLGQTRHFGPMSMPRRSSRFQAVAGEMKDEEEAAAEAYLSTAVPGLLESSLERAKRHMLITTWDTTAAALSAGTNTPRIRSPECRFWASRMATVSGPCQPLIKLDIERSEVPILP